MSLIKIARSEIARLVLAGFLVGSAAVAILPSSASADQGAVVAASL